LTLEGRGHYVGSADGFRAESSPQPPQGRELVIVDLGHVTIMPPPWPERRAATPAGPAGPAG
jgi:hypothetical protein